MGLTIKSIIKLFLVFFFFQLVLNAMIEISPNIITSPTNEQQDYRTFLVSETNIIDGEETGQTLLSDFISSMETEDLFNDGIIESFLGGLKVVGQIILFVIEIALLILITPSIFINILLYNFIGSSTLITSMTLILNVGFYMLMFYIILKARTQ